MPTKYLDDFAVGDKITTQAITITEAHLVTWVGLTMVDFYPLHVDEEYAKGTMFKLEFDHGPLILSMAIGLVCIRLGSTRIRLLLGWVSKI